MLNKIKNLGFTLGHMKVILGGGLLIAAILFFQNYFSNNESNVAKTTDTTEIQGKRAQNAIDVANLSNKLDGQNATPSPTDINGNVLGSSTNNSSANSDFQPRGAPNK